MMSNYNIDVYRNMIALGKSKGYQFLGFEEAFSTHRSPVCLLRHDVDVDVHAALEMARVEADIGVSSTYFLMLRSPCYNLMSRSNSQAVRSILELGHNIGLHYDQGFDVERGLSQKETIKQINRESNWLENEFSTNVNAVSFHQPNTSILQSGVDCGSRINTYDKTLRSKYNYYSDSNRVFALWTDDEVIDPKNAIASCFPDNIQILVHPMWWVYDVPTTESVWDRALENNFLMNQEQLLRTERAYGKPRDISIINKSGV